MTSTADEISCELILETKQCHFRRTHGLLKTINSKHTVTVSNGRTTLKRESESKTENTKELSESWTEKYGSLNRLEMPYGAYPVYKDCLDLNKNVCVCVCV